MADETLPDRDTLEGRVDAQLARLYQIQSILLLTADALEQHPLSHASAAEDAIRVAEELLMAVTEGLEREQLFAVAVQP
jgi:hypothetical protein